MLVSFTVGLSNRLKKTGIASMVACEGVVTAVDMAVVVVLCLSFCSRWLVLSRSLGRGHN